MGDDQGCITEATGGAVTAGYSGTPLYRKLGLKEDHRVAILSAPDGFDLELPEGATLHRSLHEVSETGCFCASSPDRPDMGTSGSS